MAYGDCSKNQNCHSKQSEESHIFLFKSKNQKRDPSAFGLRMTEK
jgi:hypothetical protein